MNNRFFLTVAVLSVMFLFSGCSTTVVEHPPVTTGTSVQPLSKEELIKKQLLKDVNSFGDKILSERTDFHAKEKLAENMIEYLQKSRMKYMAYPEITAMIDSINKVAENIYSHIHYMSLINDNYQLLMSGKITDINNKIQVSDNLRQITAEALSEKELWSKPELEKIRTLKRFADRQYHGTKCSATLLVAKKQFSEAKTHKVAVNACEKAMEAIDKTLKIKGLWSYSEENRLAGIKAEFKRKKEITISDFKRLVNQYSDILLAQQKRFANNKAASDINESAKLLKREEAKWWNWGLFGHPRDNLHALYRALKLAERPGRSRLVNSNLRNRAAQVYNRIYRRFSSSEQQEARRYSAPPVYMRLAGFPHWSVEKAAEEEWYRNRQKKDQYFDIEHTDGKMSPPPIIKAG